MTEILITCGAYEAIYSAIAGHVDVGDEVIIIEPYYDCYEPIVRIFNGVPRFISLKNVTQTCFILIYLIIMISNYYFILDEN